MPLFGKVVIIKRSGQDGTTFPLMAQLCVFGRGMTCDIRVQLPNVSREHCAILVGEDAKVSVNAYARTLLNGTIIEGRAEINHKDVLTIADRSFRFEYPPNSIYRKPSLGTGSSTPSLPIMNVEEQKIVHTNSSSQVPTQIASSSTFTSPKRFSAQLSPPSSAGCTPMPKRVSPKVSKGASPRGRHGLSPLKSPKSGNMAKATKALRRSKNVSFGPYLSPEHFDKSMPASTPVKKGSLPTAKSVQKRRLSAPHIDSPAPPLVKKGIPGLAASFGAILEESPHSTYKNIAGRRSLLEGLSDATPNKNLDTTSSVSEVKKKSLKGLSSAESISGSPQKRRTPRKSSEKATSPKAGSPAAGCESLNPKGTSTVISPKKRLSSPTKITQKNSPKKEVSTRKSTPRKSTWPKSLSVSPKKTPTSPKVETEMPLILEAPNMEEDDFDKLRLSSEDESDSISRELVPKIPTPSSPDSNKTQALRTIHASQLVRSNTPRKARIPKLFSEALKDGLEVVRKGIPLPKKKKGRLLVGLATRKKGRPLISKTPRVGRRLSRHANAPDTIVIEKTRTRNFLVQSEIPSYDSDAITPGRKIMKNSADESLSLSSFPSPSNITTDVFVSPLQFEQRDSPKRGAMISPFMASKRQSKSFSPASESLGLRPVQEVRSRKVSLCQKEPEADYCDVSGVNHLKTPRRSYAASYDHAESIKGIIARAEQKSPKANYTNVVGVKELFGQAGSSKTFSPEGLEKLFASPESTHCPLSEKDHQPVNKRPVGVATLMRSPVVVEKPVELLNSRRKVLYSPTTKPLKILGNVDDFAESALVTPKYRKSLKRLKESPEGISSTITNRSSQMIKSPSVIAIMENNSRNSKERKSKTPIKDQSLKIVSPRSGSHSSTRGKSQSPGSIQKFDSPIMKGVSSVSACKSKTAGFFVSPNLPACSITPKRKLQSPNLVPKLITALNSISSPKLGSGSAIEARTLPEDVSPKKTSKTLTTRGESLSPGLVRSNTPLGNVSPKPSRSLQRKSKTPMDFNPKPQRATQSLGVELRPNMLPPSLKISSPGETSEPMAKKVRSQLVSRTSTPRRKSQSPGLPLKSRTPTRNKLNKHSSPRLSGTQTTANVIQVTSNLQLTALPTQSSKPPRKSTTPSKIQAETDYRLPSPAKSVTPIVHPSSDDTNTESPVEPTRKSQKPQISPIKKVTNSKRVRKASKSSEFNYEPVEPRPKRGRPLAVILSPNKSSQVSISPDKKSPRTDEMKSGKPMSPKKLSPVKSSPSILVEENPVPRRGRKAQSKNMASSKPLSLEVSSLLNNQTLTRAKRGAKTSPPRHLSHEKQASPFKAPTPLKAAEEILQRRKRARIDSLLDSENIPTRSSPRNKKVTFPELSPMTAIPAKRGRPAHKQNKTEPDPKVIVSPAPKKPLKEAASKESVTESPLFETDSPVSLGRKTKNVVGTTSKNSKTQKKTIIEFDLVDLSEGSPVVQKRGRKKATVKTDVEVTPVVRGRRKGLNQEKRNTSPESPHKVSNKDTPVGHKQRKMGPVTKVAREAATNKRAILEDSVGNESPEFPSAKRRQRRTKKMPVTSPKAPSPRSSPPKRGRKPKTAAPKLPSPKAASPRVLRKSTRRK